MSSQLSVKLDSLAADFTDRLFTDLTVDASPAAAAETIIATVNVASVPRSEMGVLLLASAAWTVGTNGTGSTLKIRRTDASGSTRYSTGILPTAAGVLANQSIVVFDAIGQAQNQVYVLTLTVTAASAASTVSAVTLAALVV